MKKNLSLILIILFALLTPYSPLQAYDSSKMGGGVVQFDGDAKKFTEAMVKEWAKTSKRKEKLRVMMTSDFPPIGVVKKGDVPNTQKSDPDDMQSMVRFLLYSNEFDVEGLIASAGTFAMEAHKKNILGVLDEYEKVYDNLKTYDPDYPTADYLRAVTYEGKGNNNGINIKFGCGKQPYTDIIGEGMDSEASNAIIAAADKPDPRPLWIGVWGGPREIAQAIWDVKNTRSEEELKTFISKLRVFLIYCQDATHEWLMNEFPELFIIESKKTYQGMFGGNDPISDLAWVNENIRFNHGPLCDVYPHEGMGCTGVCEGDSPAFMYLVSANRGINDPEDPTQASWGGQYVRKENTNHYVDGPGKSTISRWREDYQKEFQERADWCVQPKSKVNAPSISKNRVIILTDIEADPDDTQSLVRLLLYANQIDIKGVVATTSCWLQSAINPESINKVIHAYGKVHPNLLQHERAYPDEQTLLSLVKNGLPKYGMLGVGDGMDSEGSDWIIKVLEEKDERPLWISVWGGVNTLAQALDKIRKTKSKEDASKLISKLRVYTISDQDDSGIWIRNNFPELFYIVSPGDHYGSATWTGINTYVRGIDNSEISNKWLAENIQQGHGPLGAAYPDVSWGVEGDTPAFLGLIPNGLNDSEHPEWGGWGGRYELYKPDFSKTKEGSSIVEIAPETRVIWTNADDTFTPYIPKEYGRAVGRDTLSFTGYKETLWRWRDDFQNDFAARMDWCTKSYEETNHPPIPVLSHAERITVQSGESFTLDARDSRDPDGDNLSFLWFTYPEAGSYQGEINFGQPENAHAKHIQAPEVKKTETIHIILKVTDKGTPSLSRYKRIIVTVLP